jgi:hypothetical protein
LVRFGKKAAAAELRFDHLPAPLLSGLAANDGAEVSQFTELKPGVPYRFALDANNLGGGDVTLLVAADALPRGTLDRLTLYPQAAVDRFDRGRTLLAKAFQLIQDFGLTEREVRHILTHRADFGGLDLARFPAREADPSTAAPTSLFAQFLRLARYAHLKHDLAGGSDDLIGVLQATDPGDAQQRLADLSRRDKAVVTATAGLLRLSASDPANGLPRLWEALQLVERLGIPPDAVVAATKVVGPAATLDDRYATARDVRGTVKARYDPDAWRQVAQPVFDALRRQQRDALVAYVLHRLEPKGIERVEQLFEYFLIDPATEPVVQTSRLRLAISSVQTFVQRCLLNLEPRVHPSALNSGHWQWMKRYRVWEANRNIFLYPEDWLEPEFRDDKTNLFTELESALLQGDVSTDLVESALFKYLKRLEEIARLQIVTVYADEAPNDPADTVLHVLGRTYGVPHKYFYRRFAHQMWTPWEPVTAEIEGDHIAAVVWRERLHLFWVTFMEKAQQPDLRDDGGTAKAADLPLGQLKAGVAGLAANKQVDLQLSWSEYYQGEWTARESGGFGVVSSVTVPADFQASSVFIHAAKDYQNGEETAVRISLTGGISRAFLVTSKNGTPAGTTPNGLVALPYDGTQASVTAYQGGGPLRVTYVSRIESGPDVLIAPTTSDSPILGTGGGYSLVLCSNLFFVPAQVEDLRGGVVRFRLALRAVNPQARAKLLTEIAALEAQIRAAEAEAQDKALTVPFFYQDDLNTFFVDPTLTVTKFVEWMGWGVGFPQLNRALDAVAVKQVPIEAHVPVREAPVSPADPLARYKVRPRLDWVADPATAVRVGDRVVGRAGGLDPKALAAGPAPADGAGHLAATAATPADHLTVGGAGGVPAGSGLNVVAGRGLSPALLSNILSRPGLRPALRLGAGPGGAVLIP